MKKNRCNWNHPRVTSLDWPWPFWLPLWLRLIALILSRVSVREVSRKNKTKTESWRLATPRGNRWRLEYLLLTSLLLVRRGFILQYHELVAIERRNSHSSKSKNHSAILRRVRIPIPAIYRSRQLQQPFIPSSPL